MFEHLEQSIMGFVSNMCNFFFQAEDGIRGGHVTGVQTCALPILPRTPARSRKARGSGEQGVDELFRVEGGEVVGALAERSEERRVGKESRHGGPSVNKYEV